jgi:hypothetical protein
MDLNSIRGEIEHMRRQIALQRKEILDLLRAGSREAAQAPQRAA